MAGTKTIKVPEQTHKNFMEPQNKSKMGLSFLVGFLGAYIIVEGIVKIAYSIDFNTFTTPTNFGYLMSILSGIITGILTVSISKERQLRILFFVVGSLFLMDTIGYLSNENFSIARMINRMLIDSSVLISGLSTYFFITKILKINNTAEEPIS